MPSILFVCTANLARSPMAAGLCARELQRAGYVEGWRVESAGTWAEPGQPATRAVQQIMREQGVDLRLHRSRPIDQCPLESFDLILTMEHGHQEAIQVEFPAVSGRTHLLSELVGQSYNVPDPGADPEETREAARLIQQCLTQGLRRLVRLATGEDASP